MDDPIISGLLMLGKEFSELGGKLAELMNLPELNEKERNFLYNLAANKCQTGDFKNAVPLFQLLVLLEPKNYLYIKGLAGTLHGLGNYLEALELYRVVYLLDKNLNIDTLFYMGDCLLNLKKLGEARENLELFVQIASGDLYRDRYDSQLKRAQLLLAGVLKKLK